MWAFCYEPDQIPADEKESFLSRIGQLIVGWSNVEKALGDLHCLAAGAHGIIVTPFHGSIEAAYYAIVSFEGRLAMNAASIFRMHGSTQEIVDEWEALSIKIAGKWRVRSLIAHSGLYGTAKGKPGRKVWLQPGPNSWAAVRKAKHSNIKYHKHDLDNFIADIRALHSQIGEFSRVCSRAMQQAEFPSQDLRQLLGLSKPDDQTPPKPPSRPRPSRG
jgi:hypothetical protein